MTIPLDLESILTAIGSDVVLMAISTGALLLMTIRMLWMVVKLEYGSNNTSSIKHKDNIKEDRLIVDFSPMHQNKPATGTTIHLKGNPEFSGLFCTKCGSDDTYSTGKCVSCGHTNNWI